MLTKHDQQMTEVETCDPFSCTLELRLDDAVIIVNVRTTYFLVTAVAKGLLAARKPGSIISISSRMGHVKWVDRAVYYTSKHAVTGMTKSMAIEWGPRGSRGHTICPTFFRAPLAQIEPPETSPHNLRTAGPMVIRALARKLE
ncbi:MAG: SDR family oxidoreductase [Paracoccaceae bacterium]